MGKETQKVAGFFCDKIKDGYMTEWAVLSEMENEIGLNEDEQDEVLDFLRAKFNYVLLQNGEGYFVDETKQALKEFIDCAEIAHTDEIWLKWVKMDGKQVKLNWLVD